MTRVIAAAVVLAALFATAPAGAESICIHENNCYGVAGPAGGGMTENFTVKLRLGGSEVVHPTGLRFVSGEPVFGAYSPNDLRSYWCVNGTCGGVYGYTYFNDQWGQRLHIYANGQCRVISDHDEFLVPCHSHE